MNIIILNAPPKSGKDVLADKILAELGENGHRVRFKDPLYRRMAELHNLTLDEVESICEGESKDQPHELLNGLIPRQELIRISEEEIKVEFGPTGVAMLTAHDILDIEANTCKTIVMTGSGFPEEVEYLKTALRSFNLRNFTVVRINRDGCTFDAVNDARGYIPFDFEVDNNVDESEDTRGNHMYQQFKSQYLN